MKDDHSEGLARGCIGAVAFVLFIVVVIVFLIIFYERNKVLTP
jgi:hypothetical protein